MNSAFSGKKDFKKKLFVYLDGDCYIPGAIRIQIRSFLQFHYNSEQLSRYPFNVFMKRASTEFSREDRSCLKFELMKITNSMYQQRLLDDEVIYQDNVSWYEVFREADLYDGFNLRYDIEKFILKSCHHDQIGISIRRCEQYPIELSFDNVETMEKAKMYISKHDPDDGSIPPSNFISYIVKPLRVIRNLDGGDI